MALRGPLDLLLLLRRGPWVCYAYAGLARRGLGFHWRGQNGGMHKTFRILLENV